MPFNHSIPYNELPPLPPSCDLETKDILKKTISASRALAELKQASEQIPNPAVLVNTIPLLEAQISSEIENVVTTTNDLFLFAADVTKSADPATKEAYRYRSAINDGYRSVHRRPIGTTPAIASASELAVSKSVDVTVASVGPYAFRSRTS